jgi:hypothetical protein
MTLDSFGYRFWFGISSYAPCQGLRGKATQYAIFLLAKNLERLPGQVVEGNGMVLVRVASCGSE